MTKIHAEKQTVRHFPKKRHHSVYKDGLGWLLGPDAEVSGLKVSDDKRTIDIDICLPDTAEGDLKKKYQIPSHREELIHIVFPDKFA